MCISVSTSLDTLPFFCMYWVGSHDMSLAIYDASLSQRQIKMVVPTVGLLAHERFECVRVYEKLRHRHDHPRNMIYFDVPNPWFWNISVQDLRYGRCRCAARAARTYAWLPTSPCLTFSSKQSDWRSFPQWVRSALGWSFFAEGDSLYDTTVS